MSPASKARSSRACGSSVSVNDPMNVRRARWAARRGPSDWLFSPDPTSWPLRWISSAKPLGLISAAAMRRFAGKPALTRRQLEIWPDPDCLNRAGMAIVPPEIAPGPVAQLVRADRS
jgi:hypothetical protein